MCLEEIRNNIYMYNKINSPYYKSWIINLKYFNKYIDDIKKCLSESDIKRANKIKVENKKNLFYLRKGLTRIIISDFINISPKEIEFYYDINGKPFIFNNLYKGVYFNISHSKEYLFIAISNKKNIGVDIEKIKLNWNYSLLAKSVFSKEDNIIFNSYSEDDKMRAFYKAWVQKEAISKALGLGISIGFNTFSVDINPKLSDNNYSLILEELKCKFEMRIKFNSEYFLSTAIVV